MPINRCLRPPDKRFGPIADGQAERIAQVQIAIEAMIERANHAHYIADAGTKALALIRDWKQTEAIRHAGALFHEESAPSRDFEPWVSAFRMAQEIGDHADDATRVRVLSERLVTLARGLMGGEDSPS